MRGLISRPPAAVTACMFAATVSMLLVAGAAADDLIFTLKIGDGEPYEIRGPPAEFLGNGVFRYTLPDSVVFSPGEVTVTFVAGTAADAAGYTNLEKIETFLVTGPIADTVDSNGEETSPLDGTIYGLSRINGAQYIDIRYRSTNDNTLDADSITDQPPVPAFLRGPV